MSYDTLFDDLAIMDHPDEVRELEARTYKESYEEFVKAFWEEVPGTEPLQWNWHMSVICRELEILAQGVFQGLNRDHDTIVNISPGTSKSSLISILYPIWIWANMPNARILSASHTDDLVIDLANKSRYVIKSKRYQELFPYVQIRPDQDSKGYYANTCGGDRYTCTVAGKSPMGFHAHFLICDDPIDPKKAVSEVELKTAKDFFDNVFPSRKVNKQVSVTILVMQRLHEEDPTGHWLKKSRRQGAAKLTHIKLPAELDKNDDDTYSDKNVNPPELADNYVDGLMDPVRLPMSVLNERKTDGIYAYSGQYLQNPVPVGGGMFKTTYFAQRVKAAPYHAERVFYIDRASTEDGGCYTAGVLLAKDNDKRLFVEWVMHGQWEPYERNQRILAAARRFRSRYGPRNEPTIHIEREGGASGKGDFQDIARLLMGFNVVEHNITGMGKKEFRAGPWSGQLAASNVWLVDNGESEGHGSADWDIENYIKEHCVIGETLIFTNQGLKRADAIAVGDMVYTHKGRFRRVEAVNSRMADSVRVIKAKGLSPLSITPEHNVLAMRLDMREFKSLLLVPEGVSWKPAEDVQPRDYVLSSRNQMEPAYGGCDAMTIPILTPEYNVTEIDLRAFFDKTLKSHRYCFIDNGETIKLSDGRSQSLKYKQKLDYTFGRFCGLWIAEGCFSSPGKTTNEASFSFNANETNLHEEVVSFLHDRWNIRARVVKYPRLPNSAKVCFSVPRLSSFFSSFGFGASNKRIPWWAWNAPVEFHKGLIEGWLDGDGCKINIEGTTVSHDLAWGMRILATRLGHWPSMAVKDNRGTVVVIDGGVTGKSNHISYSVSMKERSKGVARQYKNLLGLYVTENKEEKDPVMVWNIQVEEDTSYTTTGGCIHNCLFPKGKYKDQVDASSGALIVLSEERPAVGMRVLSTRGDRNKELRIYTTDRKELCETIIEEPSLFISLSDHFPLGNAELPPHAIQILVDSLVLQFSDIQPEDKQDSWGEIVHPYELEPEKLIMTRDHAKKLWAFITKKRSTQATAIVIQDDLDRRAISMAMGIAEILGKKPESTVFSLARADIGVGKKVAPNSHVYQMTKTGRSLVV